jgi:hypothetical protein
MNTVTAIWSSGISGSDFGISQKKHPALWPALGGMAVATGEVQRIHESGDGYA